MEGSCLPVPEPEPFTAEQVRTLVEGVHRTTLAYRPRQRALSTPPAENGLPMTVVVALRGEPRIVSAAGESCNREVAHDVTVTLRLDKPALDVIIDAEVHAFSSRFAVVQSKLDGRVATALGLPAEVLTLSLAFDVNGMSGTLDPHDGCGAAVFPADARCPMWSQIAVDLERERAGLRPREALSERYDLANIPLRWMRGPTTTLAVSLAEVPGWACSNSWVDTFCPEALAMPVSVQVAAADGSVDAELPAELTLSLSTEHSASSDRCESARARTEGEIEEARILVERVRFAAGTLGAEVWPPERGDAELSLRVWMGPDGTRAEAEVAALAPGEPELAPPLDSTLDEAGSTCVASPGRGSREMP